MTQCPRTIFALERANQLVLAFAAENAGAAEMLAEAQWFVRSLALHYARIHSDGNEGAALDRSPGNGCRGHSVPE